MPILIRKVAEPYGWLGNMSPYPVRWQGQTYRTTEALFQCLRFTDQTIIEDIRSQKSPMGVKMVAKKHRDAMVLDPCSPQDLENMRLCLRLKLEQHPQLKTDLLATGDEVIIEDCSKRPRGNSLFWGAASRGGDWNGKNWLGKLWMELRSSLRTGSN